MNELLFPLAAVTGTFFVLIPALTLLSKAVLAHKRKHIQSWARFGAATTFAWLVAPTLLPIAWLTSAALHQVEPTQLMASCFLSHSEAAVCVDTLLLLGLLVGGMVVMTGWRVWRERPRLALEVMDSSRGLTKRVTQLAQQHPQLARLRVVVVRHSHEPIYTLGLLRLQIVMDACFVRHADDEMLVAALLHEQAHVAGMDTLRSFLVRLCLSVNPAKAWLIPDFEHWRSAREALCDGEAVHQGGEALALAEGLVQAARFRCGGLAPQGASMLCGHNAAALKLRLTLLLHGPAKPVKTFGHVALTIALAAALILPHVEGLGVLDLFHFEVERLLSTRL